MLRCPFCFHALGADSRMFECAAACAPQQMDAASRARIERLRGGDVRPSTLGLFARKEGEQTLSLPAEVTCRGCQGPTVEVCPDCLYRLPDRWRDGVSVCVAMTGPRTTGKSTYIGVAVKQLGRLAQAYRTTLTAMTANTATVYREVYEAAVREARAMSGTPMSTGAEAYQREPLIYSMGRIAAGRELFVVLRDIAGEDLQRIDMQERGEVLLPFLPHADGVVYMVDPLNLPEIVSLLQGLIPTAKSPGDPAGEVLATVKRLATGEWNGRVNPRIAVAIAKFDVMERLRDVQDVRWSPVMTNPGAAFARDRAVTSGPYHEADGVVQDLEVRSLLQRMKVGHLINALDNDPTIGDHRFFAVSALGTQTEGEFLSSHGISPLHVLDPLRWIAAPVATL